ncbi:MAG TPA: hypothetical protein VEK73_16070 [Xanthobacteraceae bacterium]|nr:hypothetical protein [Xanthobacteraceae bacterium]
MRSDWFARRKAGLVWCVAFAGALAAMALAMPASAADFNTEPQAAPPPAAYAPPPGPAPVYAPAPYAYAPVPYYRPYPYYWRPYALRPYWWGPRYAGWYGRPWGPYYRY